jgi:hypothetical protein
VALVREVDYVLISVDVMDRGSYLASFALLGFEVGEARILEQLFCDIIQHFQTDLEILLLSAFNYTNPKLFSAAS